MDLIRRQFGRLMSLILHLAMLVVFLFLQLIFCFQMYHIHGLLPGMIQMMEDNNLVEDNLVEAMRYIVEDYLLNLSVVSVAVAVAVAVSVAVSVAGFVAVCMFGFRINFCKFLSCDVYLITFFNIES